MRSFSRLLAVLAAAMLPWVAHADAPGEHPRYLHALTDLRDAHWVLSHPREGGLEDRELRALDEISGAISAVERAASWDGKDARRAPAEDVDADREGGRLRRVSTLLRAARADIARPEDNYAARDLQFHAVEHLDRSIRMVEELMVERERSHMDERRHEEMMREHRDRDERSRDER